MTLFVGLLLGFTALWETLNPKPLLCTYCLPSSAYSCCKCFGTRMKASDLVIGTLEGVGGGGVGGHNAHNKDLIRPIPTPLPLPLQGSL